MNEGQQASSPPRPLGSAPVLAPKPMPFAQRVKKIEFACSELGVRQHEVLAEVRNLAVDSYYRHCKRSPSASITIAHNGWEATFLDAPPQEEPSDPAAVPAFLNLDRDTDSMSVAEREAIRCERIALTVAATLDHPDAALQAPWPRVMARPVPGPRTWVTYEEALNAFYMNHLPKALVPYIRAAGVVLDTLYGGADARPLALLSRKTPRVAALDDALRWLRERSSKATVVVPGTGMPIKEVIEQAKQYVKRRGGVIKSKKHLAEVVGCARSSITKACELDPYLRARYAESKAEYRKKPRVQAMGDFDKALTSGDWKEEQRSRDDELSAAIAEQEREMREDDRQSRRKPRRVE